jgi:hypothetical protein
MEKFIAHRLSEGNKIFPTEILIENTGLTIKIPGLFGGKTQFFDYKQISSVSIDTPMIGYSTITFYAAGTKIAAYGFKKDEVNKIKQAIDIGKSYVPTTKVEHSHSHSYETPKPTGPISVADELLKLKQLLDAGVLTKEEFDAQKSKLIG